MALYAKNGNIWINQNQLAKLSTISIPNISMHLSKMLYDIELETDSVIKNYLITADDGKFTMLMQLHQTDLPTQLLP